HRADDRSGPDRQGGHGQEAPGGRADASHAPSPSLVGLCHAYTAGNKSEHGKALDNPAFTILITTAGGKDKVDGYCQALLASSASGTDTAPPGKSGANGHNPAAGGQPAG